MKVIVIGCGRVGSVLSYQLYKKGHQVTVIDRNVTAFDNLPVDFQGRIIEGDVLTRNVLHRAELENADALAAATNSDSLNALIAHVARTEYHVSKVVARNYDPRQRPLQEAFGIPVVSSASWGAQRIEELLSDIPLRSLFLNNNSTDTISQLEVPEILHGHSLQDLLPEDQGKPLAVIRAGQPIPVSYPLTIEAGDLIYLIANPEEIEMLRRRINIPREGSN